MDALGINWINLCIYSIIFAILYLAIKIKLVPVLDNALALRQKEISKAVNLSKIMADKEIELKLTQEKFLKKMQSENKKKSDIIISRSLDEATQILEKAKSKAKKIIQDGQVLVDEERNSLNQDLENKISQMVKKGLIWTKK